MNTGKKTETTQLNQGIGLPGMFSAFTDKQSLTLRIIAISVGIPSCFCGLINILVITNLHSNHTRFRHTLLRSEFTFNFFKCFFLTLYSILQISNYNIEDQPAAYNTLGFLIHVTLSSTDAVALFLTWHFAMLIFKPKWIWYSKATRTYEGGLFKYRYYVYGITVVYSLLSSFLVFINFNTPIDMNPENVTISKTKGLAKITHTSKLGGYKPYVTIIGAPQYPFYYGLLFSWMFRYLTILSIFTVFLAIYLNYMIQSMKIRRRLKNLSNTNNDVEDQLDAIRMDFSSMVVEEFKKSQQKFKKQMNTIFLYPLSYFLLIIAPLVENIEQKLHDKKHGPIIQITIIVAMCHPANCFYDTLIFFCIEKPLKFSWANYQKNLIINNYLIPQDKTGLNTQDKYYLTHKTLLGRLKWYHSKEVSSLIKEGAIVVEDEDKIEIPIRVRLINRFQHWLPFRKTIDLDELHYDINIPKKPCTIIKPEDIENTHRSILTRSIRSFNMDSDSNTDNTPQDDWVVNILKDKNIHSNKSEQFQHILNGVRLADGDIELQSNFTANEEMDDHIDDILEEHAPDDNHDKHVDITDFLNG